MCNFKFTYFHRYCDYLFIYACVYAEIKISSKPQRSQNALKNSGGKIMNSSDKKADSLPRFCVVHR